MKTKTALTPTEELHLFLDNLEETGMAKTKAWATMWGESLRYFFSDQLHGRKEHTDWDWVIVNYIWPAAIQEISKLSKARRSVVANPADDSDVAFAEIWKGMLQYQWDRGINKHGMRLEQIAAILDGNIFGYRVSKIYWENRLKWDEKAQNWLGDVKHKLWHPADFWALGEEHIDDGPCGTVRFVELDWAIKQWPDHKAALEEEADKFTEDKGIWSGLNIRGQFSSTGVSQTKGTGGADRGPESATPTELISLILSDKGTEKDKSKADVKIVKLSDTYWYDFEEKDVKDEEDVPKEELLATGQMVASDNMFFGPDGQEMSAENWPKRTTREYKRPEYPNGRHILRVGHATLNEDQKYPYERWPFVVTPHYLLPHMWQGIDGVQLYKGHQDMINVSVSHLVNNMKQYGDRKVMVEPGAITVPKGRDKKHFRIGKGAGNIIRVAVNAIKGKRIQFVDPAPIPAAATQLYSLFATEFKNIHGLQDPARGVPTPGEQSATESQLLTISSNDRIALQNIYEDEWAKEISILMAQVMQKNYDVGRYVRVLGEDNAQGIQEVSKGLKDLIFDIDIEPTIIMPWDQERRIAQHEKAFALFAQPVPNVMLPEMLKLYEIPGYKKLLDRYGPWQQYMKFLQLYEAVKSQQITPEQAIQLLIQAAMQQFGAQQNSPEGIEARNQEKEKLDKGREKIYKEGQKDGKQEEQDRQAAKEKAYAEAKQKDSKSSD